MNVLSKRDLLLQTASKIFADKGFEKTTISEIAKRAGVGESTIYEYFGGKEDLLFNIPVENTKLFNDSLVEHLKGVKGADNKLRKVLWHYLNFHGNNRDYATIILFELRPNRRFYQSDAYNSIKAYNRIVVDILKEGIQEGIFRENSNVYLFRNLIFGAFDHIITSWLLFDKPQNIVEQSDALFDILIHAIRYENWEESLGRDFEDNDEPGWVFDKRKTILRVAEEVFADKGYDKTRISDISKILGIGEATLYEYFKNKEDLLFNIPVQRTESMINSLNRVMMSRHEAETKLRNFVWHYLSFLQANKSYVAILLFELRSNRRFYASELYQSFKKYNNVLIEILKQGQREKIFRAEVKIHLVRHMIFGAIDHTALTWILFGKPPSLLGQGEAMIQFFIRAIKC
jgi:TetR/AcrR family fatty acid metabolism transcriptional regulator